MKTLQHGQGNDAQYPNDDVFEEEDATRIGRGKILTGNILEQKRAISSSAVYCYKRASLANIKTKGQFWEDTPTRVIHMILPI